MFFGLFSSVESRTRKDAANWLELADKCHHYRRDVLTETERQALAQATQEMRQRLKERADAAKLKLSVEALEAVLRRVGGAHYPRSWWAEHVEFFLVAAIVILGIRTYFVQPFKIPTNSMWPSYNGMTPEVFAQPTDEPAKATQALRLALLGARPRRLDAPADGEILIPVASGQSRGVVRYDEVKGRDWGVFPGKMRLYTLVVGDATVTTTVPLDFDFDWAIREAFFPQRGALAEEVAEQFNQKQLTDRVITDSSGQSERVRFLRTGRMVKKGQRVLSFDILTGDQLFVDRFSYHFIAPRVGDGFVFRTGGIPMLSEAQGDQYYIKRLVGTPGDVLEIKETALYRNDAPITGAPAFARNATREGKYPGYEARGLLAKGNRYTVPQQTFLTLGDNSANSYDGRYWGTVPAADVVGRPLFIYYPFTRRWGVAP